MLTGTNTIIPYRGEQDSIANDADCPTLVNGVKHTNGLCIEGPQLQEARSGHNPRKKNAHTDNSITVVRRTSTVRLQKDCRGKHTPERRMPATRVPPAPENSREPSLFPHNQNEETAAAGEDYCRTQATGSSYFVGWSRPGKVTEHGRNGMARCAPTTQLPRHNDAKTSTLLRNHV